MSLYAVGVSVEGTKRQACRIYIHECSDRLDICPTVGHESLSSPSRGIGNRDTSEIMTNTARDLKEMGTVLHHMYNLFGDATKRAQKFF
eukprot:2182477-Karenia_brevis.AAC.1